MWRGLWHKKWLEGLAAQGFSDKPPGPGFLITSSADHELPPGQPFPLWRAPLTFFSHLLFSCLPICPTRLSVQLSAELIWTFSWPLAQPGRYEEQV